MKILNVLAGLRCAFTPRTFDHSNDIIWGTFLERRKYLLSDSPRWSMHHERRKYLLSDSHRSSMQRVTDPDARVAPRTANKKTAPAPDCTDAPAAAVRVQQGAVQG